MKNFVNETNIYAGLALLGSTDLKAGQIYLANESRQSETQFNQPLTEYAVGFMDSADIVGDLNAIAPEVPVAGELFSFKKHDESEPFLTEADDIRAVFADFKRVEYTGTEVQSKVQNKGLVLVLEKTSTTDATRRRQIAQIIKRLMRNELRRAVGGYTGAGAGSASVWNSTTDPDMLLKAQVEASADAAGEYPNLVWMTSDAWTMRQKALRASDKAGAFASSMWTPQDLANFLMVDEVRILKERVAVKKGTGDKAKLVAAPAVFIAHADAMASTDDNTNVKRFTWGGGIQVHVDDSHAKLELITIDYYSRILTPTLKGIVRLNPAEA